ncbi:hypothetical protein [Clostridium ihumii]|uniref:hypothetical protein n=1 Tax=Clostridium ihumii TaxID=1470356 RepID=UPI000590E21D|nr:hypothetical protein [Clostridium ihumii]
MVDSFIEFYRAKEDQIEYLKYEESFKRSTAIICEESDDFLGILEYNILNFDIARILNLNILRKCKSNEILNGMIEEVLYWNPYIKEIIYEENEDEFMDKLLKNNGFVKDKNYIKKIDSSIEVFKINIEDIKPEQLTVDKEKLDRVYSWVKNPEDIIISCVKIDDKIVSIDGHSRLVCAYLKGFSYVYGYFEKDNVDEKFFRECISWCEKDGIYNVRDLSKRVVTSEEHENIWIKKCHDYFKTN